MRGSHVPSDQRARRTKSRGSKGFQLTTDLQVEVGFLKNLDTIYTSELYLIHFVSAMDIPVRVKAKAVQIVLLSAHRLEWVWFGLELLCESCAVCRSRRWVMQVSLAARWIQLQLCRSSSRPRPTDWRAPPVQGNKDQTTEAEVSFPTAARHHRHSGTAPATQRRPI